VSHQESRDEATSKSLETADVLDSYLPAYTNFNGWMIQRRYRELTRHFVGTTCLELGSSEGSGTDRLLEHFDHVVAVEGSASAAALLRDRYSGDRLEVVNALFEDVDLGGRTFDTVVLAHVLEHVDDPAVVLSRAKDFVSEDGVLVVDVPNADSLHRQVGVQMGLLQERTELNAADLSIGHRRVYNPATFRQEIVDAGLTIQVFGGMFIKVLSNSQTEVVFDEDQLEALFRVGADNPNVAAEIYVIATP
jgi:2-polyprenyl-3-methyl-5-hydroxy-6-metoxy-1,4-benzoquinol methylase